MPLNGEQQAEKQQNKNQQQHVEQTQQREDMVRRDNAPAPEQILQNNVQQQRNIFEEEAPQANLFEDFVVVNEVPQFELSEKDLKLARKKLVKDNAQDESETFSLLNNLESNPFKILDWLKGSAEVDGASASFKNLIKSFENLLAGTAQNVKTLAQDLMQAATSYLSSHSKKPVHLYGRQRVTMCKEILNHIDVLPSMVMWQKHFCKDRNHNEVDPQAAETHNNLMHTASNLQFKALMDMDSDILLDALKKRNPGVTEKTVDTLHQTSLTKFMRNCVEMMKIEPSDGFYQEHTEQKEKDAKWNKEWIDSYLPMLEAYEEVQRLEQEQKEEQAKNKEKNKEKNKNKDKDKNKDKNADKIVDKYEEAIKNAQEKVEQYKAQRRPLLEGMVEEIMSITEEEIEKIVSDPDYYTKNYNRLSRLSGIALYTDNNQNPIDFEYFHTLPESIQSRFDAKCNLLSVYIQGAVQETINQATNTNKGFKKTESRRKLNDSNFRHQQLNAAKQQAFHPNTELEEEKSLGKKVERYINKVNAYFSPALKGDASKVKEDAENVYQSIMGYIDTYKNKTTGQMDLPPIEAAKKTLASGTLEEKAALLLLFANLHTAAKMNNCTFKEEYNTIYDKLADSIGTIKESSSAKTDSKGLSETDAMRLAFISSSFGKVARNNFYLKLDKEISNLKFEENATEEDKEAKIRETYINLVTTTEGLLFEASAGLISNMMIESIGEYAGRLTRKYMATNEEFNKQPFAFQRGVMIHEKYKGKPFIEKAVENKYIEIAKEIEKHRGIERKDVPSLSKALSEKDVQALLKKQASKEKSIPTTIQYKTLKHSQKADDAAVARATAIFKEAHKNQPDADLNINEIYSAASEKVLNASIEKMTVIYHYYDQQQFSDKFTRKDQYTLTGMHFEDVTKKEEELTPEEQNVRNWNQAFIENYKKFKAKDESGTADFTSMLMERFDDMMRYDFAPEKLLDTNWVVAHYKELETLGTLSGCVNNMEDDREKYQHFLSQYNALPYKEVLDAKSRIFSAVAMVLYQLKPVLGLLNILEGRKTLEASSYLVNNEGYYGAHNFDEQLQMYRESVASVMGDIKKYREVRDNYLKKIS